MSRAKILVTGAAGFLGAWVTRALLERGIEFALFDRDASPRRLEALLPEPPASYGASLEILAGDIADPDAVRRAVETSGATAVIHLAALQMPACQADPVLGAEPVLQTTDRRGELVIEVASGLPWRWTLDETESHTFRHDGTDHQLVVRRKQDVSCDWRVAE